jgi:hypothetical protein
MATLYAAQLSLRLLEHFSAQYVRQILNPPPFDTQLCGKFRLLFLAAF